jgi:UPF0271 protein
MAVEREDVARAIGDAILAVDRDLILVVLAGSPWEQVARRMGLRVAREVFADRAVDARGALVPRAVPGAVIHDAPTVVERSLRLVLDHRVTAVTGEELELHADTICLHGDTPGAVSLAATLRMAFERAGVETVPMAELVKS